MIEPSALLDRWDRAGLASGHAWSPCDVCGEAVMQPRAGGRRCIVTPGCLGTHRPATPRPTPLQALRAGLVTPEEVLRHLPEVGPTLRRLLGKVGSATPPHPTPPEVVE
jgi:hypothetical protein